MGVRERGLRWLYKATEMETSETRAREFLKKNQQQQRPRSLLTTEHTEVCEMQERIVQLAF